MKIAYCQATYSRDFDETKECIERVFPHVNMTIISYDQSLTDDQIKWLENNKEKFNIVSIKYEWTDDMPAMRNSYLKIAKELGVEWLCVSDPDELFSEELAKNLRSLIEKYGGEGYSILGVPVRDQFSGIGNDEWFDDLDRLKEYPAGYRETEYWKPMLIFKIFPDIRYEGIGVEKKVHETLLTQYKQKTVNLPKEYFYIHKKNVIKIWRNAARNMFISGGGDNVGGKNRLWVELRQICGQIGIDTWNKFEEFVNLGINNYSEKITISEEQKKEFRLWLEAALKALPTKEGTETRETAKWYLALHKDEIDQKILDLIKTIPTITQESELENFVTQTYYQILGRHPDRTGLDNYVQKIMRKELKRHELADIFRNSLEHKEKFSGVSTDIGTIPSPGSIGTKNMDSSMSSNYKSKLTDEERLKYDKIQKFVEQMYNKILGRSADIPGLNYYTKAIMEKRLKPVDLPDIFRKSEEYVDHRRSIGRIRISGPIGKETETGLLNNIPSKHELKMIHLANKEDHDTVAICIMGVKSELPMIKESIEVMKNVVDEIHIQTDDFTKEDIDELKRIDDRVKVHIEKWKDNFSDYKNRSYSYANTEWTLICDADEIPTKELAGELKSIIKNSDRGNNYDMVSFDVIDTLIVDGKVVSENRSKGGKTLLHWNIPNIYHGDLHVWMRPNYYPFKSIHSDVAYRHIKEKDSILERSARNVWMGGGGDTVKEKNPLWKPLRDLSKELGFDTWKDFKEYCKKGNIDIRILDIFKGMCDIKWKDEELMDLKRFYLKLHPEETKRLG